MRPGEVQVRFTPQAVAATFTRQPGTRGLERLRLTAREIALLDSLRLARVRRVKPQLEAREDGRIVVLTEARLRELLGRPARRPRHAAGFAGVERDMILTFSPDQHPDALCAALRRLRSVESCTPLYMAETAAPVIPNDANFPDQWGLNSSATGGPSQAPNFDIDAPESWETQKGDAAVVVAVLDAGVDVRHRDLYEKIWINVNELPPAFLSSANALSSDAWPAILTFIDLNAFSAPAATQSAMATLRANYGLTDANGNGYIDGEDLITAFADGADDDPPATAGQVDDLVGWDFVGNDPLPLATTNHGTAVAGLVGAMPNNSFDIAGVGWNTRIMAVNSDGMWPSVDYALKHVANIITSSQAPVASSAQLEALLAELNTSRIGFTAALGNVDQYIDGTVFARSPYTIAISNFRSVGVRDFGGRSSYSVNTDVAGPGAGTWSLNTPTGSMPFGGTSGANPIVAGALSLLHAQRPGLTPEQYRQVLRMGAVDVPPVTGDQGENTTGFDYYSGWGLANARNSLASIAVDPWAEAKLTSQRGSYSAPNRRDRLHVIGANEAVTGFAGVPGGGTSAVQVAWAPGPPQSAGAWSTLASGNMSYVDDGTLATINRSALATGINTLRLTVTNGGRNFVDYVRADVPHAFMDLVDNTLIFNDIPVRGFAFHPQFARWDIQVAQGHTPDQNDPTAWTTAVTSTTERPPIGSAGSFSDQQLTTALPLAALPDGAASLRLALFNSGNARVASMTVPILVDASVFPYQAGFPATLPYPYRHGGPAPYDLDGDGGVELVVTNQFQLYAYRGNGSILAGWPATISSSFLITSSPAIGDITGDGLPEIVVRTLQYETNKDVIHVFDRNGQALSPWPLAIDKYQRWCAISPYCLNNPFVDHAPVLADLDADGDLEIVIAARPADLTQPAGLFAYQGDGSLWRSYTVSGATEPQVSPVVADIDADGELDLVSVMFHSAENHVVAWRASGAQLFNASLPGTAGWRRVHGIVAADLDGDRDYEITISSGSNRLRSYQHNGTVLPGWNDVVLPSVTTFAVGAADLNASDGSDTPQILVTYDRDTDPGTAWVPNYSVALINADGSQPAGWTTDMGPGLTAQQPTVFDVDNDGMMEVLVGPSFLNPGATFATIGAKNHDGTAVADNRFPIYVADAMSRAPALADLDGDGDLELAVSSKKWGGAFEVYALDAADRAGGVAWGMQLHDPLRSSDYHGGIRILEPTSTRPTDVGPHDDPAARQPLLVRLRNELPLGTPDAGNVTVRIGGLAAPVSAATRVEGETWLIVTAPTQAAVGTYLLDLEWNDGGIRRIARQKDAVRYGGTVEPTDHVLVVDRSGSMSTAQKYLAARTAANFYVSARGAADRLGMVTFNTAATDELPGVLTLGPDGSANRVQVAAEINASPTPAGMTSIGQGLRTALLSVLPPRETGRKRALVLLSDGLENTAPFWDQGANPVRPLFEQPEHDDVVVHTIALGPDADRDLHDVIAGATGGMSRFVYLGSSVSLYGRLADAYKQVDEELRREVRVLTQAETLSVGQAATYSITVPPGARRLTLALSYADPGAEIRFTDVKQPDGSSIPATQPVHGPTSQVLTLANPTAGTYFATVQAMKATTEVLTTAAVLVPRVLVGTLAWPEPFGVTAMRGTLLATVLDDGTVLRNGVSIMAQILAPDRSVTVVHLK
ncbi:MAG: FG-GAP-like repeat-containing protein, partial [Gemmatimonadales bacterium]